MMMGMWETCLEMCFLEILQFLRKIGKIIRPVFLFKKLDVQKLNILLQSPPHMFFFFTILMRLPIEKKQTEFSQCLMYCPHKVQIHGLNSTLIKNEIQIQGHLSFMFSSMLIPCRKEDDVINKLTGDTFLGCKHICFY